MSENAKKILKLLGALLIFFLISLGVFLGLKAAGITDPKHIQEMVDSLGGWTLIAFLLLQIIVTTILCIIPGTTMVFIVAGCFIFGPVKAAIICSIGVVLSSLCMFIIGDKLGEKIVIKLVGEEDLRKAQKLLEGKSIVYLPLMFLFPFFPDDALCMAAGLTNMRYKHFTIITSIFRPLGVIMACLVFYFVGPGGTFLDLIGVKNFGVWEWIIFIIVIIIVGILIILFVKWLEKKITAILAKRKNAEK